MKKKITAFVLGILMVFSLTVPSMASEFSDPDILIMPKSSDTTDIDYYLCLYNQLKPAAKAIYDGFLENIALFEMGTSKIKITFPSEISRNDVAFIDYVNAVSAFTRDHSELFWIDFNNVKIAVNGGEGGTPVTATIAPVTSDYYISPYKTLTKVQSDRQALANGIDRAVSTVDRTADICDQLLAIHDWLCANTDYNNNLFDYDMRMFEAVPALDADPNTKPVCEGYSRAFKLLCDELGIPCVLIAGDAQIRGQTIPHMWNAVYIDGAWYAIDSTWDDDYSYGGSLNYDYFLVGSQTEINGQKFSENHIQSDIVNSGGDTFDFPELSETKYEKPQLIPEEPAPTQEPEETLMPVQDPEEPLDPTLQPEETLISAFGYRNEYYAGMFSDVATGDWYEHNVASAYALGLMVGNGDGTFNVDGGIKISETISIAARIHSAYYGKSIPASTDIWYEGAVSYALENGLITEAYSDYEQPITRREFAEILSRALPADELAAINDITAGEIPDVSDNEDIYMLYNAGILRGNEDGTFYPDSTIRRCEVAAIVTRMVDYALRVSFDL